MEQSAIDRRVRFLLDEAASNNPHKCQVVKMTLRVLSNVVSVGKDVSSPDAKRLSKLRSKRAHDLKQLLNDDEAWIKRTINEHPDELKNVWQWIEDARGQVAPSAVIERLKKWPMVVVTKEEDIEMRPHRNLTPEERYKNVEVLQEVNGKWVQWQRASHE